MPGTRSVSPATGVGRGTAEVRPDQNASTPVPRQLTAPSPTTWTSESVAAAILSSPLRM